MKVKVDQKPKTGNSEDGNREWNANMAVKLLKTEEEGLSYQQNPVYIQKRKSHSPFCKQKPIIVWESTNYRKPEVNRRKTTGLLERKENGSTRAKLLGECCHHRPQNLIGVGLQTFHFGV